MVPTLTTPRLVLNAFTSADAPAVEKLAGDVNVARTTLLIPHPYPRGAARPWVARHATAFKNGDGVVFAIRTRRSNALIGCVSLLVNKDHDHAELGYWLAKRAWNRGYMTEAARACVEFGFQHFGLVRIFAHHFASNPASGRVLEKIGMRREGVLRSHVKKWGVHRDIVQYGRLRFDVGTEQ